MTHKEKIQQQKNLFLSKLRSITNSEFWQRRFWQPPHFVGFKIIAVLMGICLWAYVTVSQNPLTEGVYTVPVSIYNLSGELALPDTNYQVQIRVQGSSSVIDSLSSHDFEAYVDLSGMEAGEATAEIRVILPDNVTLVAISQENITLTLEPRLSQSFSVQTEISGSPAEQYQLLDAVLSPEMVTLYGAAGQLEQVARVCVYADISGLSENYNKSLPILVFDADGQDISSYFTISPSSVNVMIPIVYQQPESLLPVRAVLEGEPLAGHQISRVVVEPASVLAFGDLATLDALYYLETETIDVSGLSETTSFTAELKAVGGVSFATESVTVVVQIDSAVTSAVVKDSVSVRNLATGLQAVVEGDEFMVNVEGASSYVEALNAADVNLYVDASGISEAGTYELEVQAELPANISLSAISPAYVQLTVSVAGDPTSTEDTETTETEGS